MKKVEQKHINSEHRGWTSEYVQDNYFKGKTVVITGDFRLLGDRDGVAGVLQALGARVTSSVSSNTRLLVVGVKPGPSKLEKFEQLQAEGVDIQRAGELELILKLHDAGADLSLLFD